MHILVRLRSFSARSRIALLVSVAFIVTIAILFSDSVEDVITGQLASGGGLFSITGALTSAVVAAINGTGYLGVFVLMFLESTSLPVPSEVILPFAGYLVSTGRLDFWLTVALAVFAGVLGGLVDYLIGWILGMRVISNYGSRFFISPEQLQRVDNLFTRHGSVIIFLSRLVPGIRTLASFPAGSAKMNLPRFIVFTAFGCLIFDAALVYTGDYLGAHWSAVKAIGILEIGATLVVILFAAWVFVRMQRRSRATAETPGTAGS